MPVERSAGAVVYRDTKKGREYLLLHHPDSVRVKKVSGGHWDFSKGHVEKGEKTEDTVRREVEEETGITDIDFVPGFKETIRYFVKIGEEKRLKFVALFLARTRKKHVKISSEHQGYAWLRYDGARERATYAGTKDILEKADSFLREKSV